MAIEVIIEAVYGPIFGMDQMCDAIVPEEMRVGDVLVFVAPDSKVLTFEVAAFDAQRTADGQISKTVGLGLRGEHASVIESGSVLSKKTSGRSEL